MQSITRRLTPFVIALICIALAMSTPQAKAQMACCLPNGSCQELLETDCLRLAGAPQPVASCGLAACVVHIMASVCGGEPVGGDADECPDGDASSLKLFAGANLPNSFGDGVGMPEGWFIPIRRVNPTGTGNNIYRQPEFGGVSFVTRSLIDLGTDYAAAPYFLSLSKLPGPVSSFEIRTERIAYSDPADFSYYNVFGLPLMVYDGDDAFFGDQGDAHFHPPWMMRRPGQATWTIRYTSNVAFEDSDPVTNFFTSVPGRGEFVPLDMTGLFNADLVDSDNADTPISFDGAGNSWLLDGHYGSDAGLPADGFLNEFQLGGVGGALLAGANVNALFDNGALSSAAVIDLVANGQDDQYLSVELLIAASGNFTSSDSLNITLQYADGTNQAVAIKRRSQNLWLDYRMLADWQQSSVRTPVLAVGQNGGAADGFARSNGSDVDAAAGESFYLFRATTVAIDTKTLNAISIADYTGNGNVAIFAALGIKRAPLEIVTDSLPDAVEGQPYAVMIDALGTPPFKNWMASGLPAGLELTFTGEIVGTPAAGSASGSPYQVTIDVEDSINDFDANYPPELATTMLTLTVIADSSPADVDDDGDVDLTDAQLLSGVLVGSITELANPVVFSRSDINGDEARDGNDIAAFLAELGG